MTQNNPIQMEKNTQCPYNQKENIPIFSRIFTQIHQEKQNKFQKELEELKDFENLQIKFNLKNFEN